MLPLCRCRCHDEAVGTAAAACQMGNYAKVFTHAQRAKYYDGGSVTDAIDAATACPACITQHCPALLSKTLANEIPPRVPDVSIAVFVAWRDAGYPQADGGEGAE